MTSIGSEKIKVYVNMDSYNSDSIIIKEMQNINYVITVKNMREFIKKSYKYLVMGLLCEYDITRTLAFEFVELASANVLDIINIVSYKSKISCTLVEQIVMPITCQTAEDITMKDKDLNELWIYTMNLKRILEPIVDKFIDYLNSKNNDYVLFKETIILHLLFPEIKNDHIIKTFIPFTNLRKLTKHTNDIEIYIKDLFCAIYENKTGKKYKSVFVDIKYSKGCYKPDYLISDDYKNVISREL